MTKYQVYNERQDVLSTHRTQSAAIKAAKKADAESVVMVVTSGTYRSTTQVWPTAGNTYTN